ncbi:MAG: 3-deoxy-8-phosphooctulonate synthase [Proteobacteria bacterium]|nr:3-deoxy-8-phosphooctulonate synthase [Pseudomonadota bacterium]
MTLEIKIGDIFVGGNNPLFLIAGPCVIENEVHTLKVAGELKAITAEAGIPFIFKASFDKANRSSIDSYRGPGLKKGLEILRKVKDELNVPVLSDIHRFEEIDEASEILDILQIPALLCRQTDLIVEAAKKGKVINIKKGQFMAPWDMKNVLEKAKSSGNENIIFTERGTTFGYNNLVTDMRSLPLMRSYGFPVVFDATHAVQLPGGGGTKSGGEREFIAPLARAAVAAGVDGLFMEVHDDPESALCDGPNSFKMGELIGLLEILKEIDSIVKSSSQPLPDQ